MEIALTNCERIIEAVEGASIVSGRVDEGEGLCLDLSNGRTLVITGNFIMSLLRFEDEKLH